MSLQNKHDAEDAVVRSENDLNFAEYGRRLMGYGAVAFAGTATLLLFSVIVGAMLTASNDQSLDFIRVNKSVQITMTMVCGLLFVFFGVSLSWAGIRGQMEGAIKSSGISASLSTASPGIVLMICGTVLIGIAATREVTTRLTTIDPVQQHPPRKVIGSGFDSGSPASIDLNSRSASPPDSDQQLIDVHSGSQTGEAMSSRQVSDALKRLGNLPEGSSIRIEETEEEE